MSSQSKRSKLIKSIQEEIAKEAADEAMMNLKNPYFETRPDKLRDVFQRIILGSFKMMAGEYEGLPGDTE